MKRLITSLLFAATLLFSAMPVFAEDIMGLINDIQTTGLTMPHLAKPIVQEIGIDAAYLTATSLRETQTNYVTRLANWFAEVGGEALASAEDKALRNSVELINESLGVSISILMDDIIVLAPDIQVSGQTIAWDIWNTDYNVWQLINAQNYYLDLIYWEGPDYGCWVMDWDWPLESQTAYYYQQTSHYSYIVSVLLNPFSNEWPWDYNNVWANEFSLAADEYNNHVTEAINNLYQLENACH